MLNDRRPNVVVFFTDQQRWDTAGAYGNPMNLTPNFDRLARKGTLFENMFTPQPVCGPARSCLQTGRYATGTGVYKNGIGLREDTLTMGRLFRESGYQTGYIGKWHLSGVDLGLYGGQEPVPESRRGGYEYWLGSEATEFISNAYDTVLFDGDNNPVQLPGYRTDAHVDAAIRFIEDNRDEPLFLFLSCIEPHHQNSTDSYPAPEGYEEQYRDCWVPPDLATLGGTAPHHLPGYYGMVRRLDEGLGRLMDALKSLGLEDDTILLFTSDHGNHFKTRNDEYKRSCHEASIRIPGAITGPHFTSGGCVQNLVSLVDIAPSLLDAASIPIPESVQGCSFLPLVNRETEAWPDDIFVQISESQVGRSIRTKRWKYSVYAPNGRGYEDAYSDIYEEQFLYDLTTDPYEMVNLAGYDSHREIANRLKARLLHRIADVEEKTPKIVDAPVIKDPGQRFVSDEELNI